MAATRTWLVVLPWKSGCSCVVGAAEHAVSERPKSIRQASPSLLHFPKECRFLTDDAVLLVHERRIDDNIVLKGPMKSCIRIVKEQLALLETAERLEMEGFRELVEGRSLTTDELYDRATENCYIHAEEAFQTGLVAQIRR